MMRLPRLARDRRGTAAAETALVAPLLIIILFGSVELGNYFMQEHVLVKALRDGARYAARQSFDNFPTCDSAPGGTVVTDTTNLIRKGRVSGGSDRLPNWSTATLTITTRCSAGAGTVTYSGIYNGASMGARYVEVRATVPYRPLVGLIGVGVTSLNLDATQQAAIAGI
jgi:hypothetical protein